MKIEDIEMLDNQLLIRPIREESPLDLSNTERPFNKGTVVSGGANVKVGDTIYLGTKSKTGKPIDGTRFGIKVEVDKETLYVMAESKVLAVE